MTAAPTTSTIAASAPPSTMRAAVATAFDQPLTLDQVPVPTPTASQVLVRIEACGLCHTDIHAVHGDWPVTPALPRIPGHEGIGIVEQLGANVTDHAVGDRVAIAWLGRACGHCRYCLDGRENLCLTQINSGYAVDGAWAEYAVVDAAFAVSVPEGLDPVEAAPLTCAGVTSYKAVKVARIQPGERVAVFGIGGLGHLAVQYAHLVGGTVIAVDVEPHKLELARSLGAQHTVDASKGDPIEAIAALGGADVALALAATPHSFEQALGCLRPGGRLICVALPANGTMSVPIFETVLHGLSIIGSIVGTRRDLTEVFELHRQGRTRVIAETRDLATVNESIAEVLSGHVAARLVFAF